ncbi:MAG: CSLREA domain-containing protein, partial [Gammaproteobacteria bacterium]|nr:CSLREA domain-containing protein [Gammaproteobacteria bacterium]
MVFDKTPSGARRALTRVRACVARAFLMLCIGMPLAHAATFTVTKTADTNDGVCNADCSLREAITAANGNGVPDTIAFNIPVADPGYNAGTGVFTITVSSGLPAITNDGTTIDGTTQTSNVGNTNASVLGAGGTVGVGPDGVIGTGDEQVLPQVAGPEIEIRDGVGAANGLRVQANNTTIRGLAILGFGGANGDAGILVDNNFTGTLIEQNVLGSFAHTFTDPGAALR